MSIPVRGGCMCGQIRYLITREPLVTSLCHCRSCRLATGAPVVAWVIVPLGGFAFEHGSPAVYRSSPTVERTFCARCGTSLTYQCEDSPGTIDIHTATLDAPEAFPPAREIWLEDKIGWMADNPQIAQYPRTSRG